MHAGERAGIEQRQGMQGRPMTIQFWKSGRNWYWHMRAGNNEIIAHGEGYRNKQDMLRTIRLIQREAAGCIPELAIPADRPAVEARSRPKFLEPVCENAVPIGLNELLGRRPGERNGSSD